MCQFLKLEIADVVLIRPERHEDGRGWFPIGHFGDRVFNSQDQATKQALADITWLAAALDA